MTTEDEVAVDWLDGRGWQTLEGPQRELLEKVARANYEKGAADAIKNMSTLNTFVQDRRFQQSLERLLRVIAYLEHEHGLDEDTRPSVYWEQWRDPA